MARATAVIVTYHSVDAIGAALDAAQPAHAAGLLDVIVVDNASTDGTTDLVRSRHPWAQVVDSGANLGYGRGCNVGLARTQTDYVIFMNPDAALGLPAVRALVDFMDAQPRAGLAAPAIRRAAGDVQDVGPLPTPAALWRHTLGRADRAARRPIAPGGAPFQTPWVCGAVMIGPTALMRRLGGFDPRFFLYFEETDLCLRVAQAGYEIWAVGAAVAEHACNASARKVQPDLPDGACLSEHFYRSRYYYFVKHHGWLSATTFELGEIAVQALREGLRLALGRRRSGELAARLQGPVLSLPRRVT